MKSLGGSTTKEWTNLQVLAKGISAETQATLSWEPGADDMALPAGMSLTLTIVDPVTSSTTTHDLSSSSSVQFMIPTSSTETAIRILSIRAVGSGTPSMGISSVSAGKNIQSPARKAMAEASQRYKALAEARLKTWGSPSSGNSRANIIPQVPGNMNAMTAFTHPVYSSPSGFVKNYQWNVVSIPAIPLNPDPLVVFSGIDVANANLQYWMNSQGGGYQNYGSMFGWLGPIVPGQPYWMLPYEQNGPDDWTVSFPGYKTPSPYIVHIPSHTSAPYWVMISNPLEFDIPCTSVEFSNPNVQSGAFLPWVDAYNASIIDSKGSGIENETAGQFQVGPAQYLPDREVLQPWYGYWLLIKQTGPTDIRFSLPTDIVFNVNTTGSMDDAIDELKEDIIDIAAEIRQHIPDVRFAVVDHRDFYTEDVHSRFWFYGSPGDWIADRVLDFTTSDNDLQGAIDALYADGGGDFAEAETEALLFCMNQMPNQPQNQLLNWRDGARKVIVTITDSAPHDPDSLYETTQSGTDPIWAQSGADPGDPYTWEWMAEQAATNGFAISCIQVRQSLAVDDFPAQAAYRHAAHRTNGTYLEHNVNALSDLASAVVDAAVGLAVFEDDFEYTDEDPKDWTADGDPAVYWHEVESSDRVGSEGTRVFSPNHAWYYGHLDGVPDPDAWNYVTRDGLGNLTQNSGQLAAPGPIHLPSWANVITLRFMSWSLVRTSTYPTEQAWVQIAPDDNGSPGTWEDLAEINYRSQLRWAQQCMDMSNWAGQDIWLRFCFDTGSASYDWCEGWYIDDVEVMCH